TLTFARHTGENIPPRAVMRLIMLPILFSLAYLGYEDRDKILDLYRAAYPGDPAKREALDQCAMAANFNRLDSADRQACYAGTWGQRRLAIAPTPAPRYDFSPSHLPGNDVRRQAANDQYRYPAGLVRAAAAAAAPPGPPLRTTLSPKPPTPPIAAAHREAL